MKRIGIIGTRRRNTPDDFDCVVKALNDIYEEGDWLVSGGCPTGGDRFAEIIAKKWGVPILIFYPNWRKYGKKAGFIRNSKVAEASEYLIACVSEDRTGGTEDTIDKWLYFNTKGQKNLRYNNQNQTKERLIIV